MKVQKYLISILLLNILTCCQPALADDDWFVSLYAGKASNNNLGKILIGETKWVHAQIFVISTGKKLWEYEDYLSLEAEGQVAWKWGYEIYKNTDEDINDSVKNGWAWAEGLSYESQNTGFNKHNEFNFLFVLRWHEFPWSNHIKTSFGIGEGLSYATEKPPLEKDPLYVNHPNAYDNVQDEPYEPSRLMNYLMFDLTFALPNYPKYHTFFRLHHRSTIFGLMNGSRTCGSNYLTAGFRYQFSWPEFDISKFREFDRTTKW